MTKSDGNKKKNKNVVKEELLLSTIFVGKWLALGIGALIITYLSLQFAYNKIYYDPKIKEMDIIISELVSKKNGHESTLKLAEITISENNKSIEDIYNKIKQIEKELSSTNKEIDGLGETLIDKAKFWSTKSKDHKKLYDKRDELNKLKTTLLNKEEQLEDKNEEKLKVIPEETKEIKELNQQISSQELEKEKVGTGGPGMWTWVAGALGIIF